MKFHIKIFNRISILFIYNYIHDKIIQSNSIFQYFNIIQNLFVLNTIQKKTNFL